MSELVTTSGARVLAAYPCRVANLKPGENRRSTVRDVAATAGLSVATVSRVLAGNYPTSEDAKRRVLAAVEELDYVVNSHARRLAGQGTRTVAILVEQVTSYFFAAVAQGVEEQASTDGRLCLVCTTGGDPAKELALINMLREQGTDAVIIVGGFRPSQEYEVRMARYAESLWGSGSVLVLCGRPPLEAEVPHIVVAYDNEDGAYAATSHLASKGHEQIAFVGGTPGVTTLESRLAGWRRALEDRGLPSTDREMLGAPTEAFGYSAVTERLAEGRDFTAILAYNDYVAAGILRAVREAGVDVPGEVSLVGYDDTTLGANLTPALTTVAIPSRELGRTAVRMALEARAEPVLSSARETVLATHVVVRDSVRSMTPERRRGA